MGTRSMAQGSGLNRAQALRSVLDSKNRLNRHDESTEVKTPLHVVRSALTALNDGRFSELVNQFDDHFAFSDHALALEFTNKTQLSNFFGKSRELYPDTTVEIISLCESGDRAVAEWKLAATQMVPWGSISCRVPIALHGSTIARVENGKIVQWSDYYDQSSSRRGNLAALFTEQAEY